MKERRREERRKERDKEWNRLKWREKEMFIWPDNMIK